MRVAVLSFSAHGFPIAMAVGRSVAHYDNNSEQLGTAASYVHMTRTMTIR
jgi:hypothetical protein